MFVPDDPSGTVEVPFTPEPFVGDMLNAAPVGLLGDSVSNDVDYFPFLDITPPVVPSIVRINPNPVTTSSVDFTVSCSEAVTDIESVTPFSDFSLTTTGSVTGASITGGYWFGFNPHRHCRHRHGMRYYSSKRTSFSFD